MQFKELCNLNHDFTTSLGLSHTPNFSKIYPYLQRHISVRLHPHVHPQHIKVLKHILYIWNGCGMQSMGLCNLNHDFTTSLRLSHTPNFPKIYPHHQRHFSVRVHPNVHPQHIKVLKHIVYTIWMRGAVYRGLEGRPTDKTTRKKSTKMHFR